MIVPSLLKGPIASALRRRNRILLLDRFDRCEKPPPVTEDDSVTSCSSLLAGGFLAHESFVAKFVVAVSVFHENNAQELFASAVCMRFAQEEAVLVDFAYVNVCLNQFGLSVFGFVAPGFQR